MAISWLQRAFACSRRRFAATANFPSRGGKLMNDTVKSPKIDDQAVVRVSKSAFDSPTLAVRDFDGREYVGRPFVFEVQIVCDDSSLSFTTGLGTHMSLETNL